METSNWSSLADRFYRKEEVYSMAWDGLDLGKYQIAGSPYGGPLALVRDERKILLLNEGNVRAQLMVYSSAGKLISSCDWDWTGLIRMGWTDSEHLICVLEDGTVLRYNIHSVLLHRFSLGSKCAEYGVADCQIWGTGLVALTCNNLLFEVNDFVEPRARPLADPHLTEAPTAMAVIEPQYTLSRNSEVLLATTSGTILVVDADSVQDQRITSGPFSRIVLSPNGKIIACFTQAGALLVVAADFSKNYSQFDTKSRVPPHQLVWCGVDSVIMYWDKILLMVGPYGDWIKYHYDDTVHLVPECDGVRVISSDKCEFLQRVPNVTEDIFKIGSTAPAAMLYDAMEHYEKQSPKADENLRGIRDELPEAVDACIEAAGHEADPAAQKRLLKAASFGKCFLEFYPPDAFVNMSKRLRVLNAVRYYEIGIPLTMPQFRRLSLEVLVSRLVNRYHHLVALRICDYMGVKPDTVLVHWACQKVRSQEEDHLVLSAIVDKLRMVPDISYVDIAWTAYKSGRRELATNLLDSEPRPADQVPLLIKMEQEELALVKAIESGDTDLVYYVVFHIKRQRSLTDFFRMIRGKQIAEDLLVAYCRNEDPELLKTYFYQADQPQESANIAAHEAYKTTDLSQRIQELDKAIAFYNDSKDYQFAAKAMEEQKKLYTIQADLEVKHAGSHFVGLSITDTIHRCILIGERRQAAKIKSDFRVPDKRYWWVKVQALGKIRDWDHLDKFSKEKKSPIGYEAFADVCIDANAVVEAQQYVHKIHDPETRAHYFVKIGSYKDAADAAFQAKDSALLQVIKGKTATREVHTAIDGYLRQLSK